MLYRESCICCMRLVLGRSTVIVSQIIIVTDTVVERFQIDLSALNACNACNACSWQMPAHSQYDNAFGITVLVP